MGWFFAFFFVSGFCSILYEIIWLRLAMAQFGITSAVVSIVLSMFMAGLGLGSWSAGCLIRKYENRIGFPALWLYALTELLIGLSALVVPHELGWGRALLERFSLASSGSYYFISGSFLALTLVPWCTFMGATIPIAMLAIRRSIQQESRRSFSFLYLANVLGAVAGAFVPLLLIELYGFRGTLKIGSTLNMLLAIAAVAVAAGSRVQQELSSSKDFGVPAALNPTTPNRWVLAMLFATGCTSMGIEVVWIREFTPYVGTVVYAFASILVLYLASTFVGSRIYRIRSRKHAPQAQLLWVLLGFCTLLAGVSASPAFHFSKVVRLMLGIAPFSGILGFVTPMLVDRWSQGDPQRAGVAYAVNVMGCILGPLLSGFLLLPFMAERWVLFIFALPWLMIGAVMAQSTFAESPRPTGPRQRAYSYAAVLLAVGLVFASSGYEGQFAHREVLRDNTATIIATGDGMQKRLLVNGVGITILTPITKMMAHLPLAFLDHPPQNALVVCFGMGTTYRSLLSWNISTTAVELVPSVPRMFWYFHPDGPQLLLSPLSHVVIDDGRRYLERNPEQYDVITLDPPPPVEAAGSSLLYSKEFYSTIKRRLRPGGILQQWLPYGDDVVQASVARALNESFPQVRVFHSLDGAGFHFIASNQLSSWTGAELVQHMPASAVHDLMEWGPEPTPEQQFAAVLNTELSLDQMIAEAPNVPALQDDRPENEYYTLRRRFRSDRSMARIQKPGGQPIQR